MSHSSQNFLNKNSRTSMHEDHRYIDYLRESQVPAFIKLFKRISLIRGSNTQVYIDLGISSDSLHNMSNGKLSRKAAAKILDGYNKYVKNYLNGGIITN